ncbi:MAG TPA: hypothetical protein VGU66_11335, partial [Candidatus Elarobacter sp.]|nr:hypothetical protein [Candidatus Elarobacter sp.]
MLPNGWVLNPPGGAVVTTGTMPQGMAASPDRLLIAVVESGYSPATLGVYRVPDLARVASIALPGAFGRPLWRDATHVLVAGANADALLDVDVAARSVRRIGFPKGSYPALVAAADDGATYAVATDGDGAVRIGTLDAIGTARAIAIGAHPGGLAFGDGAGQVFATVRSRSEVVAVDVRSRTVLRRAAGLHPSALAVHAGAVYVAETDADAVGVFDARDLRPIATIPVGDANTSLHATGVSPNALSVAGDSIVVSLGAANAVAILRNGRVAARAAAGWYPTDALAIGTRLYILDGKGEGTHPNAGYRMGRHDDRSYVGTLETGSLRAYDLPRDGELAANPVGADGWNATPPPSVVRPGGPLRHVFFVLKENRSYDQVLGDVAAGNGDPKLAWFGARVTPNQHAIAARFGLFDNAYASGEVSAAGHLWADAAFANDYVERFWPPSYGNRRDVDDLSGGDGPRVPAGGYLWDAARRAHVSFRDYGELVDPGKGRGSPWIADVPSLRGRFDPLYAGWNLDVSDLDRVKEWRREFAAFDRAGTLPQLELIWLPNDHTSGSKPGKLTPSSYVAINDRAVGEMVDTLSHARAWSSSVMFIIEDDAQDGPDH